VAYKKLQFDVEGVDEIWSPAIFIEGGSYFDLSITGTWTGKVWLQRSHDGATWKNVESYTANTEETGFAGVDCYYRVGALAGADGITAGKAVCEVNK
jgi:hypothetical protein